MGKFLYNTNRREILKGEETMQYITLIGIVIIVIGFALKLDVLAGVIKEELN